MSDANRARTAVRPQTVAESPLRSAPLLRTAPPTLLLCWRARYSSRCTPSRCRQRRSPFSCSAPASHPATCSSRGQAAEPLPLRGRSLLPVRPFSAVLRKRGARRPIISPPLSCAAPGSARHLLERTRPRRRTFSADSRQLARSISTLIPQGS